MKTSSTQRKMILFGIDGMVPRIARRLIRAGDLPNLAAMQDNGFISEIVPTFPASTPPGWAAALTGSSPSSSGVEGFTVHDVGDRLDARRNGCTSSASRSEFLWQSAERQGLKSIIVKFPMSWPSVITDGVQVDGAAGWGGLKCEWDLDHSSCYQTGDFFEPSDESELSIAETSWSTRDHDNLYEETARLLTLQPAGKWRQIPSAAVPVFEGTLSMDTLREYRGPRYEILGYEQDGQARLTIAADSNIESAVADMAEGEWSPWIVEPFVSGRDHRAGAFRFKLMNLDLANRSVKLYVSQIHDQYGFVVPEKSTSDLIAAAGPFPEWTGSYDLLQGWIDPETQMEIYEHNVEWLERATDHLMSTQGWNLFFIHTHIVDWAQHLFLGLTDPRHPDYSPEEAPYYSNLIDETYRIADRLLGRLRQRADNSSLVVAMGDHGHEIYHTSFFVNHLLARAGLLALRLDRATGTPVIDWSRTLAYGYSCHVYVNLIGRDPEGVVSPKDQNAVVEDVLAALNLLRDERTGEAPVRIASRREDLSALGLHGETVGDVLFAMEPGYHSRASIELPGDAFAGARLMPNEVPVFRQTRALREFTGEHDTNFPLSENIRTLLFMEGDGVSHVPARATPIRMIDIAPTLSEWLGIAPPADNEGGVVADAFVKHPAGVI